MQPSQVSIRDLRNRGGDVVDRAERGERVIVTRDGRPVAELHPLTRSPVPLESLLERWRRLPEVDPTLLRAEVDDVLDGSL